MGMPIRNNPFVNVVANGMATLDLPLGNSYNRIILQLGGTTFTKSMITLIKVKMNGKTVFENTGARLDAINKAKGIFDAANFLTIDFTEPRAKTRLAQFLGNYNTARGVTSLTVEVTIAGATAPTLTSFSEVSEPAELGALAKQIVFSQNFGAAGKYPMKLIDVANRGALIKRVHFFHGGNMSSLEVKKNRNIIFDDVPAAVNDFNMREYGWVPQTNLYTYNPVVDNNHESAIVTADMTSLDFNVTLSAADTVVAVVEVIDILSNM